MSASPIQNKNFLALFVTQFCGALNDNVFKNALIILMTYKEATILGLDTKSIVALAGGIFILPFFIFSAWAGQISDRYQRTNLARGVKWAELLIMLICSFGFLSHQFEFLLLGLFLMGLHSTFFGPIKYSIIPDLVKKEKLNAANAYVESGTFMAILLGTILGGATASLADQEWVIVATLMFVSIIGLIASYKMPLVTVADPDLKIQHNPLPQTWRTLKMSASNPIIFRNILGISWFWFLGAAILSILPVYTKDVVRGTEGVVTFFLTTFTVGIALGAGASSYFLKRISYSKTVRMGAFIMTLGLLDWAFFTFNANEVQTVSLLTFLSQFPSWRLTLDLLAIAAGGGLFTVPQTTSIQNHSKHTELSRIIAANNIMNALFIVAASLLLMALYGLNLDFGQILITFSALNFLASMFTTQQNENITGA